MRNTHAVHLHEAGLCRGGRRKAARLGRGERRAAGLRLGLAGGAGAEAEQWLRGVGRVLHLQVLHHGLKPGPLFGQPQLQPFDDADLQLALRHAGVVGGVGQVQVLQEGGQRVAGRRALRPLAGAAPEQRMHCRSGGQKSTSQRDLI